MGWAVDEQRPLAGRPDENEHGGWFGLVLKTRPLWYMYVCIYFEIHHRIAQHLARPGGLGAPIWMMGCRVSLCVSIWGKRQTYHQISSSCDLCMCVLGIDNNELGFVFLPRHQTPHRLHERNVLTREPSSVFLHLFLPTPGPNHNHQDGCLQTCNSLYFCRQPNLHTGPKRGMTRSSSVPLPLFH